VLVLAHAGHWLVQLIYLAPLVALVAIIAIARLRERREARRGDRAGDFEQPTPDGAVTEATESRPGA